LGGVASGLAAYFDKPAKTIRLIFLAPLLLQILFWILDVSNDDFTIVVFTLSAGSLVGFSIILYVTLWVILPKAITPYQKMEMRGEKIDLARNSFN
jgi:phage shock protein PspC (stress-responsive transcriptional regulator)